MKGFKGFKKGLVCRDKQYKENTVFEEEKAEVCECGMHYCENPMDVLEYYGFVDTSGEVPVLNEFTDVEALDEVKTDDKKKYTTTKLRIGARLSIHAFVEAFVEFTKERTKGSEAATNTGDYSAATNTGDYSAATNTGYYSAATNTGDYSAATNTGNQSAATNTGYYSAATNTGNRSAATNTGYYSAATASGKNSVAVAWGYAGKAKGAKGCYLVLAEYTEDGELSSAKMEKVDGERIKEDTFYTMKNGEFVEAGEN